MNALAQIIHLREMLFPPLIENLQHHLLLYHTHQIRADTALLLFVLFDDLAGNSLPELLFVQPLVCLKPLIRRCV